MIVYSEPHEEPAARRATDYSIVDGQQRLTTIMLLLAVIRDTFHRLGREDLALGDVQRGVLRTGDLGVVSAIGAVRITGRLKRMGKLFGVRVDLDMLETLAGTTAPAAVIEGDNALIIFAAGGDAVDLEAMRARIASRLNVKQRVIDVRRCSRILAQ